MSKKTETDPALKAILEQLLKEEDNKFCADCKMRNPRWASVNLGVFICTRCAGQHRGLGVHISKVRSVNLDTWTADQVQVMQEIGNKKGAEDWEYSLPADFKRPGEHDTYAAENFIKAKYQRSQYRRPAGHHHHHHEHQVAASAPATATAPAPAPQRREEPKPRPVVAASSTAAAPRVARAGAAAAAVPTKEVDLMSMSDPSDGFSAFQGAPAASAPATGSASLFNTAAPVATAKDDILAMYSQPMNPAMGGMPMGGMPMGGMPMGGMPMGGMPMGMPAGGAMAPGGRGGFTPNYNISMGPARPMGPPGFGGPMGMPMMGGMGMPGMGMPMGMPPGGMMPMYGAPGGMPGGMPMGYGAPPAGRGMPSPQQKW